MTLQIVLFILLAAYIPWINYVKGRIDSTYEQATDSNDTWHRWSRWGLMYVASVFPFVVVFLVHFGGASWWHFLAIIPALTRFWFRLGVFRVNKAAFRLWYGVSELERWERAERFLN